MRISPILATGILLVAPLGAGAATISVFTALIDGDQANMGQGTGSPGQGAATMTYDSDTSLFEWFIAWQDLLGVPSAAHFHGPALPGQNAGVEVTIDHSSNPSLGSATLTSQQTDDLFAGLWYINIHTDFDSGGVIHGQVRPLSAIPLPGAIWAMAAALVGLMAVARRH